MKVNLVILGVVSLVGFSGFAENTKPAAKSVPVPVARPTAQIEADKSAAQAAAKASVQSSTAATDVDLSEFDKLDPNHVVPTKPFKQALTYFKMHPKEFPNKNYIVIIDYTQNSSKKRMYIVNLKTGAVEQHKTAHGRGSDPNASGYAKTFSNDDGTHKSSVGFFRTAETYVGKHGYSLRLEGLSPTNDEAYDRAIVIHAASYVNDNGSGTVGRSWGCPAIDPKVYKQVISEIKEGALIYAYNGK